MRAIMGRPETPGVTYSGPYRRAPLAPPTAENRAPGAAAGERGSPMGTGDTDATTAAARLRLIQQDFTTPRRDPSERRAPASPHSPALIDLGIFDYMRASVDEVITHTRAEAPQAPPAPAEAAGVYGWMREHTEHLEPERRLDAEAIVYRQSLEHALAMGQRGVVQPHPCPACGCYGLQWQTAMRRAVCVYKPCHGENGRPRTYTLAQLAHQHVKAREISSRRAT